MTGIVDYGAGNLRSVSEALSYLGVEHRLVRGAQELELADRLILPGVGSFGHAVEHLHAAGLFGALRAWLDAGRPYLGICLGLQLLLEGSEESPGAAGFGFLRGTCRRFQGRRVPQIGWNNVEFKADCPLFAGLVPGEYFYFVHSYSAVPEDTLKVVGWTEYGIRYASAVGVGQVWAVQFHPEKSGRAGLTVLKNWLERCAGAGHGG
ncbi:MAG: imidazole glycerol phosphate synthase subunit HisH [bacterium]|jgi:imidazole glycerol phosphate synthase glutamine amidotransferase subunit|nr:imidazole glycerol phosphate synthase subunit HisH [candidate division KSB1 bacterium]MDH7560752.1 imidazole glycerol phosphate synthase subunit HisH [bacterium]